MLENYFPFWDKLTNEQQETLERVSNKVTYNQGAQIHSAGVDCVGILLVEKGNMRAYMLSEDGREISLFHMEEGDVCVLSATCIIDSIVFEIHIDAETDLELIQIDSGFFDNLATENVYVENFIYKAALERFSQFMEAMENILFTSIDKRLALFLLEKSPLIKMTHEQIAKDLGTAREVISRLLKRFATEGYVSLSRGSIKVLNKDALEKFI